jgi:hypothetical protein
MSPFEEGHLGSPESGVFAGCSDVGDGSSFCSGLCSFQGVSKKFEGLFAGLTAFDPLVDTLL